MGHKNLSRNSEFILKFGKATVDTIYQYHIRLFIATSDDSNVNLVCMYSSCTSESNFGRSRIEICSYRYTVQPGPIFSSIFSMHFSFFLAKVCVMYTTPKLGLSQNMVFYDKIRYLFIVYFPVSKGFHLEIRKIRTQIPD